MGQFPICKLKWGLLRTSVTPCTIEKKIKFLTHLESFMWERKFEKKFFKKSPVQPPNGVSFIFKLPFPNGSYRNMVCRALWALCLWFPFCLKPTIKWNPNTFFWSAGVWNKCSTFLWILSLSESHKTMQCVLVFGVIFLSFSALNINPLFADSFSG